MKAVTPESPGGRAILHERPIPTLHPGYLLVKTYAVALNPADSVSMDFVKVPAGVLLGCDYSGEVVEIGPGVLRQFHVGDRVCGCHRAGNPENVESGTFAEYITVKADLQMHIPDAMSWAEAASFGVVTLTTGRCLFDTFQIPYPELREERETEGEISELQRTSSTKRQQILIYGGSSAMGTSLIQFAKLAGLLVLTTSSQHNMDLVKSYNPDFVVDHYDEGSSEKLIQVAAHNVKNGYEPLRWCVDCISRPPSTEFCSKVLADPMAAGGETDDGEKIYSVLTPFTPPIPWVTTVAILGYSFLGEKYTFLGRTHEADLKSFERSMKFAAVAEKLLVRKTFRSHKLDIREGGLQGIVDHGLPEIRAGKVSGKKIVYLM